PTPELCVMLQNRFSNYKNFFLIPLAVDVNNSFREFNIAKHTSWGISSFYKFNSKGKEINARKDLYYDHTINSMTIRLDTFLKNFNIEQDISFLWIDTQGNDLNVLKSLGEKINKVKKGKCEASLKFPLYTDSNNDAKLIQDFLKEKKFKSNLIEHNESNQECDVHFEKI
ncbi:FkbM family methyltransferase, partial [Candidatus Pelagibacter sp.]|nr:FkbM family methyltransferase [Candidatus Pelagibacter sp.]